MKHAKEKTRRRVKFAGIAVAAFVVGITLLVLSQLVLSSARKAAAETAETQPAGTTQPAVPAQTPTPSQTPAPVNTKLQAAQRMSGLLLLFSLMGFGLALICVGWIVYDVRRSRPAWMRQKKFPVRTPPKKTKRKR